MTKRTECNVEKVAMFIEIESKAYAVALPQEQMAVLVKIASGMSESGSLPVIQLPEEFKFTDLSEEVNATNAPQEERLKRQDLVFTA